MFKTHIRSYAITDGGDIRVWAFTNGDRVDLSKHYADAEHPPRAELRQETHVDVFRYADGALAWTGTPNGYDVPAAKSFDLLLGLFLEDVALDEGAPRAY